MLRLVGRQIGCLEGFVRCEADNGVSRSDYGYDVTSERSGQGSKFLVSREMPSNDRPWLVAAIAPVSPVKTGATFAEIGDVPSALEELFYAVVKWERNRP